MPATIASATATIAANGPVTFCPGGNVTLTVTSGTADTYQWTKNTTNISGATNMTYAASSSGNYAVKITKSGASATSPSIAVNAAATIPQPVVTANGPLTFCQGGSVTLTSSSTTGNRWSTNETTQSIVVSTTGSYTVTVTSGNCNSTSASTSVSTNGSMTTPTITVNGSTKICPGSGVVLTSSLTSSGGYTWSTGETTRSIFADTAGTYWVETGTAVCKAKSSNKYITMKTAPPVPIITASGSTNLGAGGSVKLTSSYAFGYSWNTGSTRRYINVSTAGTYNVTVTGYNGCKSTSAPTVVTTPNCTPPAMPVITSNKPSNIVSDGQSIILKSTVAGGYLWSNGKTTQSITVTTAGTYTVRAYNAGECYTISLPITVYDEDALGRDLFTAASDDGQVTMMTYPNPAHGEFTISFSTTKDETCLLQVYDLSGRILSTQEIHAEEGKNLVQMNSSTLAPGIYVVQLTGESLRGQVRFMVQ